MNYLIHLNLEHNNIFTLFTKSQVQNNLYMQDWSYNDFYNSFKHENTKQETFECNTNICFPFFKYVLLYYGCFFVLYITFSELLNNALSLIYLKTHERNYVMLQFCICKHRVQMCCNLRKHFFKMYGRLSKTWSQTLFIYLFSYLNMIL